MVRMTTEKNIRQAILYIVATPIGNLDDISVRACHILKSVDIIAAEDTRHSSRLLSHYGIGTSCLSLHEHNEAGRTSQLLDRMGSGHSVALISDAGTPLISDPGYRLVVAVRAAGFDVVPVPGACAFVAALSVAGISTHRFSFEGFLPSTGSQRRSVLDALSAEPRTLVFYESPHRIMSTVKDMRVIFGDERKVSICRELTKRFETVYTASLGQVEDWMSADPNQQRGEFVIVVSEAEGDQVGCQQDWVRAIEELRGYMPLKKACKIVAGLTGASSQQLYRLAEQE
jgi:16S rRNA (cytidine1402-2'-O)-methyltransferase